tara:strand:- start:1187 stop:1378 length:192 start_codon:yes stop_codon:yes gene_type:complete
MVITIFAVPLNLGVTTWSVILLASLGFVVMFIISSAMGDFQGLIKTTLENDAKSRDSFKNNEK